MPDIPQDERADQPVRIGPAGNAIGVSPRMVRYLESQGVISTERGPGLRGHRHFPPPELHLGRAAARAMDDGHATGTLRAIRELAERRVADVRASDDALAWFELLALARAVELARRADVTGPHPPDVPDRSSDRPRRR